MKKLAFVLLALLAACQSKTNNPTCVPKPDLPPCASHMDVDGTVATPWQAKEFCSIHPEFEKCLPTK